MRLTNRLNLPQAIYNAIANDGYSRGECDLSVTQLIAPPRKVELQRRHDDEITEDVSERIWILIGKAVHGILEAAQSDDLAEERLFMGLLGWRISGAFDNLAMIQAGEDLWRISDYKVTSVWSVVFADGKSEWEQQLNCYAHLLRLHSFPVAALEIVAICRDWRKSEALKNPDYPQTQVAVIPIRLWSHAEAQAFIEERVRVHQAARAGELPLCTAEERWERPTKWAFVKQGAKRATKLCDTQEEAEALLKPGYRIERRDGESLRCKSYCSALPFCEQGQQLVKANEEE